MCFQATHMNLHIQVRLVSYKVVTLEYRTHLPPFCKHVLTVNQTQSMVLGWGAGLQFNAILFISTNIFWVPTVYKACDWQLEYEDGLYHPK